MSLGAAVKMHEEHRQWASERSLWRDQIRQWQRETQATLADLKRLEAALIQHEHGMGVHAAAIRLHEQGALEREHMLAQYSAEGNEEQCMAIGHAHLNDAQGQARQQKRHAELTSDHHALVTRLRTLIKEAQTGPAKNAAEQ